MKRIYTPLLTLFLLLLLSLTAAGSNTHGVSITVDGVPIDASRAYITEDGVTMVPLRLLAQSLGYDVAWDQTTRTVRLTSGDKGASAVPTVVLDPGHGGESTGAVYGGVYEKDLNLSIALLTAPLLEAEGVTVVLTRTDDRDVGLYERTDLSNGLDADLFVSIHCNASLTNPSATGIYTAAYTEDSPGWDLAQILRGSVMAAAGAGDMGTEARPNLAVLRTSAMPAALVECGYMSTPEELSLLTRPDYQSRLARGIADGILAFLTAGTSRRTSP